jgi:hypothetical protein
MTHFSSHLRLTANFTHRLWNRSESLLAFSTPARSQFSTAATSWRKEQVQSAPQGMVEAVGQTGFDGQILPTESIRLSNPLDSREHQHDKYRREDKPDHG